ncbi:MAG: hypothetical protein ACSI46_15155 [Gloeotrichia echinulata DVL01]
MHRWGLGTLRQAQCIAGDWGLGTLRQAQCIAGDWGLRKMGRIITPNS